MTEDEFWEIMRSIPEPAPVLFRLYYDSLGNPIEYTHENKPGNYIDVDPETFRKQSQWVKVVDNRIVKITPPVQVKKLVPGNGTSCHPDDVCIVVRQDVAHIKWSLKTNETN